jgi:hypothetical protein
MVEEQITQEPEAKPIYKRWWFYVGIFIIIFIVSVVAWAISWWILIIFLIIGLIGFFILMYVKYSGKEEEPQYRATTPVITQEQKLKCRDHIMDTLMNEKGKKLLLTEAVDGIIIDEESKIAIYWIKAPDYKESFIWNCACRIDNIYVGFHERDLKNKEFKKAIREISGTLKEMEIEIKKARDPSTGAEFEISRIERPVRTIQDIPKEEPSPIG